MVTPVWIFAYDGEVPKYPSNMPKFRLKWPNFIYKSSKIVSNIRQISPNFSQKFRTIERQRVVLALAVSVGESCRKYPSNMPKYPLFHKHLNNAR